MKNGNVYRLGRLNKVALLAAAAMCGSSAMAANRNWVGGAFATWNVPGNWSPAGVPGVGDSAFVLASGGVNRSVTIEHDGSQTLLANVTVDSTAINCVGSADQWGATLQTSAMSVGAGGIGQYVLHSGLLEVQGALSLGQILGGNALFEMTGGTLTASTTTLGVSSGIGFFRQNAGLHRVGTLTLGMNTVSSGTYNMNGGTLEVNATLKVGDKSTGSFGMSGGSIRSAGSLEIGVQGASNGTFIQDGAFSSVDILKKVRIGAAQFSSGTYSLNFGSLITPTVIVGDSGSGTMNVGGQMSTQELLIGNAPGGSGFFRSSGTIISNFTMVSNIGATATAQQFGGGFTGIEMQVGQHLGSSGRYDMFGGNLNMGSLSVGGNNGGGIFNHTGGTVTSNTQLTVGSNARYMMSGGTLNASSMLNTGSFTANAGVASFGVITNGGGSLSVSGTGQVIANNIRQRSMHLNNGTIAMRSRAAGGQVARVEHLTFGTQGGNIVGALDVNDTALMITNMPRAEVVELMRWGRNHGAWNGQGITSSAARTNLRTTLGVLSGEEFISINGQGSAFNGHLVVPSDVLVRHTFYGDTDFNGIVNFDDYSRTDAGYNNGETTWFRGDFDLNGQVNFDDYALIDAAFNSQAGSLQRAIAYVDGSDRSNTGMSTPALAKVQDHVAQFGSAYATSFLSAVPEPNSTLAICAIAVSTIGRRRRHG